MAARRDEDPTVAAAGPQEVAHAVSHHHATTEADRAAIRAEVEHSDKRFATLRAELARRGYQLHAVDFNGTSTYLIARWDSSRDLRDLTAVELFLQQIGTPG